MSTENEQDTFLQMLLEEGPVTLLKVKEDDFVLEAVKGDRTQTQAILKAGNIQAILRNLKHEPAEAVELESAIADIENQLMPVINDLPEYRRLATEEAAFRELVNISEKSADDIVHLEIDTVEEIFNRLVDVAYGTPAYKLDIPEYREFAGTVLFLRELMHHANYSSIAISLLNR